MEVYIDGIKYIPAEVTGKTVVDILEPYIGAVEYDGVVETIQRWFYNGDCPHTAWCATTITYALAMLGIRQKTMKNRQDNVYLMLEDMRATGTAKEISINDPIKRGDIIFLDYGNKMSVTSNKHVTAAYEDTPANSEAVKCLGGNQSDMLCVKTYTKKNIAAIMRPAY
ncbi:MAG: hypothetical protein NC131_11530 [Roseburia sp.]|nr:hypothetical protein [Roseburia sp.]